jgi:hypothetical protein
MAVIKILDMAKRGMILVLSESSGFPMNEVRKIKAKRSVDFFAFFVQPYDGSLIRKLYLNFKEGHER